MGSPDGIQPRLATELQIRSAIGDLRAALDQGPRLPNIWCYYSNKNRELQTLVGDVTFIQAVLLEGDPSVRNYTIVQDQRSVSDFSYGRQLVVYRDNGLLDWYFCGRHANVLEKPTVQVKQNIQDAQKAAATMGATFCLQTEKKLANRMTEFWNWATLSAAMTRARDSCTEREASILMDQFAFQHRLTVRAALELPGAEPAQMIAAIGRALAAGLLHCELTKKQFDVATELSVGRQKRVVITDSRQDIAGLTATCKSRPLPLNKRTERISHTFRDLTTWPTPVAETITDPASYRRNKQAVEMFFENRDFDSILRATGLHRDWVRALARKCLARASDGNFSGFRGLIKYARTKAYHRKAPLPSENIHEAATAGYSGAMFSLFDRFPDLITIIEAYVLKLHGEIVKGLPEARISWRTLQEHVLSYLTEQRVKADEYPFSTRDRGYTSLARIGRSILFAKPAAFLRARSGKDAARRAGTGKGIPSLIQANRTFQVVELDFHKHDSAAVVDLERPTGGYIPMPVPRWWIGCLVDTFNRAILGSSDSFEKQTTQSCVLDLVDSAIAPPDPLDGLKASAGCADGCWLPNQILAPLGFQGWDILKLDRAWAHKSTDVISAMVATTGCAVGYSRPRAWWARTIVERTFLKLTTRGAQRLPTTYGSSPQDTKRDEPERQAIALHIKRDEICLLAKAIIREINETAGQGSFWESAMTSLRRGLYMDSNVPRCLPESRRLDRPTQWATMRRKVEAYAPKGIPPSVRIPGCRYCGAELALAWGLVGRYVYLQINRRDIRIARVVSTETGEVIGSVKPEQRWSLYCITRQNFLLIQKYGKLHRQNTLPADPTSDFLHKNDSVIFGRKEKGAGGRKTAASNIDRVKTNLATTTATEGVAGAEPELQAGITRDETENSNRNARLSLEKLLGTVKP